jgi:hypothetical protein
MRKPSLRLQTQRGWGHQTGMPLRGRCALQRRLARGHSGRVRGRGGAGRVRARCGAPPRARSAVEWYVHGACACLTCLTPCEGRPSGTGAYCWMQGVQPALARRGPAAPHSRRPRAGLWGALLPPVAPFVLAPAPAAAPVPRTPTSSIARSRRRCCRFRAASAPPAFSPPAGIGACAPPLPACTSGMARVTAAQRGFWIVCGGQGQEGRPGHGVHPAFGAVRFALQATIPRDLVRTDMGSNLSLLTENISQEVAAAHVWWPARTIRPRALTDPSTTPYGAMF